MDQVIQHLLEASLEQQAATWELTRGTPAHHPALAEARSPDSGGGRGPGGHGVLSPDLTPGNMEGGGYAEVKNPRTMVEAGEAAKRILGLMQGDKPEPATPAWLTGCGVHGGSQTEAGSHCLLRVNGHAVHALVDSSSTITLLHPAEFPWLRPSSETLPVSCVHGDVQHFPTTWIRLEENGHHWPLTVGLVADLPMPLRVGRDFPGFSQGHHPVPA
ncbi:hypothetical protein SRHO_G00007780 [Serrasalmus rhombeus]